MWFLVTLKEQGTFRQTDNSFLIKHRHNMWRDLWNGANTAITKMARP